MRDTSETQEKERLIERGKQLFAEGVELIVGQRRIWGQVGPFIFSSQEELDDMETEPRYMLANIVSVVQKKFPAKRIGLVARGCDERALRELEKQGFVNLNNLEMIGIVCSEEQSRVCNCEKPFYFKDECTGCWKCLEACPKDAIKVINVCPVVVPSEHNLALGKRKAIYIPFPQAVPKKAVIDKEHCLSLKGERCHGCSMRCPPKAILHEDKEKIMEERVGAIVVASGYDIMQRESLPEYDYGNPVDVITGLQFERLLSASGPTGGEIRRLSDGKIPKEIVFVQCAGSRDPEHGVPYCSRICCMYTAKHALLYKHRVPDGQAYVFYIDIRAAGKGYEEFVQKVMEEERVLYLRGKVSKIFRDGDKVVILGADTLTGKKVELKADMVVLATAMLPSKGVKELAKKLKISTDEFGFIKEAHPKLRPLETLTPGVYIAGVAQFPKDIPDTVAQSSGAASKVISLFSGEVLHEPVVAEVDKEVCSGCGNCVNLCTYQAISLNPKTKVAEVNEIICEGCGACAAGCPSGAIQHRNFMKRQIFDMVDSLLNAWEV